MSAPNYPAICEANSNRAEQCPQLTRTLMSSRGTLVFLPHCWHATARGFNAGSRNPARVVRPS